jgi:chemotaxis family two-component system response regulator Rcp1
MGSQNGKPVEILLVEDNPGDIRFTSEVLKETPARIHLSVVKDGLEALSFLKREGEFAGGPRPDLILLDRNLPKKTGLGMLDEIRGNDELKSIPVVILTTSESEPDINKSFSLYVSSYLTKPIDVARLSMVVQSVQVA